MVEFWRDGSDEHCAGEGVLGGLPHGWSVWTLVWWGKSAFSLFLVTLGVRFGARCSGAVASVCVKVVMQVMVVFKFSGE